MGQTQPDPDIPLNKGSGEVVPRPDDDPVHHPSHYTQGKIEVIDFIEDQKLDFHRANAIKYICRAPYKGTPITDIKKAIFYLDRYIDFITPKKTDLLEERIDSVINSVCTTFKTTYAELRSRTRDPRTVHARIQIYCALRDDLALSFPKIARLMNRTSPTVVRVHQRYRRGKK